jgi:hypothetical protein
VVKADSAVCAPSTRILREPLRIAPILTRLFLKFGNFININKQFNNIRSHQHQLS